MGLMPVQVRQAAQVFFVKMDFRRSALQCTQLIARSYVYYKTILKTQLRNT